MCREFRQQVPVMTLALVLPKFDGDAHTQPGFNALHRALQPAGFFRNQTSAKSRAHPEHIFGFNEHSAGADVARARPQMRRTPFDF